MSRRKHVPPLMPVAGKCRGYAQSASSEYRRQRKILFVSCGGQSERLTAEWGQIREKSFHHMQRSMRRRMGSSLAPHRRHGQATGDRLACCLLSSPSCSGQSGHVCRVNQEMLSRISGSRDRLSLLHPSQESPSLVTRRHLLQPSVRLVSVKAPSVHFQTSQWCLAISATVFAVKLICFP